MRTDMTAGKPMKILLDFTIPVFIGNVFQQFYNMVDAIIVGKFVGTKGIGSGWFHRDYHVFDPWISDWPYRWLYGSYSTEIRCRENG